MAFAAHNLHKVTQLTQQKNTPDGKTIVSPEKFPGRSSTNHSIVVSGDPRFAGTIKITTSAVIDNRANLNYLLTHSGLDYKRKKGEPVMGTPFIFISMSQ